VTSRERMAHKVALRAEQAFYKHGLHNTKGRTGILILVSLLERRVHVLADKGLNDRVPAGTWDGLVKGIINGIRTGQATDALCAAIATCGALLAHVSPVGFGDNPNELPDRLIEEP
ncbi:MAG: TPM domain-containing protein, partial [Nitrospirota bacterium]